MASTDKGVCYFGNAEKQLVEEWLIKQVDENIVSGQEADAHNSRYLADIKKYFKGEITSFDWTYDLRGTSFQRQVWEQLLAVPYGETMTYGEIAERINRKSAVRAVGGAIGRNPVMIAIPCHRIMGKNGRLTGFSGGLPIKRQLLEIEGIAYYD
ncbi:methylated-DNA--[protein]-cysteine S-methyltransferase [Macrococcus lamae]|uniref:methylated-DNA--[protein]-cysteine S-methyltransferase n=2 Tax=Macrococcus lamae TaxID=198484 RepID=A0A4V3BFD4_9STAP|nr:methylated-DNA--[protein]-cysteine S-methyltransferase [Macrococcus lamae]